MGRRCRSDGMIVSQPDVVPVERRRSGLFALWGPKASERLWRFSESAVCVTGSSGGQRPAQDAGTRFSPAYPALLLTVTH
jgi:hypothetical protein